MKTNWDKTFSEAHMNSWPTASVAIQNANPSSSQGGRNIFKEDNSEIMAVASRHGFRIVGSVGKVVSFLKS